VADERTQLEAVVRAQAAEKCAWERAEMTMAEGVLRDRLALLGVTPGPDTGVALMAVAMLLSEGSPEFGGDYRDALGEVAVLGLALLGECPGDGEGTEG
jgi:hypothetical protein